MFFFFVGGVEQQAGRILRPGIARCVGCGSKADLVEYDKVLKLFFVRVWRWPGKDPLLHCSTCNLFFPNSSFSLPPPRDDSVSSGEGGLTRCSSCDGRVDPGFRFCPFCGSSL